MHRSSHVGYSPFVSIVFILSLWPTLSLGLSSPPVAPTGPLALESILSENLEKPVFLTEPKDSSHRLFIVEQNGRIRIIENGKLLPKPFLNISSLLSTGGEKGLLGLAFHPDYERTGRYFVNYTRERDGATVVAEYQVSADPNRSQQAETILLVMPQPYSNHNGGMIAFGPDKLLYIGMGDGGSRGDPENRGQNPNELLGKILRIDVDRGKPYAIPSDNPFAKSGGKPEIFATGFRNPWRFSFDRETGELWVGDVGQNDWEEIAVVKRGENHGWRFMEGTHCFHPEKGCHASKALTLPILDYAHDNGRCSVTGGYTYQGTKMPRLVGTYIFGDFCTGEIFGYKNKSYTVLLKSTLQISSFGEDANGELYVLGWGGTIHRLEPAIESAGLE